ncbi:MAG: diguanylate cyclase [Lachnospiraceae bacterium]|nr:diguanylate cyclase [Lachnospiraceae bacterium]
MDLTAYSEEIREEIARTQQLITTSGRRVFTVLKRLEKRTAPYGNHTLSGLVCFYYAQAHYFRDEPGAMHRYLMDAIGHLLRGDDPELLARSYNLFAVAAQAAGCFDVAQNYFRTARSFVEDKKDSLMYAMINANIGDLLVEMGDYKQALGYSRQSIPVVKSHKDDPLYIHNIITAYVNYGLNQIYVGNIHGAKKTLPIIDHYFYEERGSVTEKTLLWYRLFYAHLALAEGDRQRTKEMVADIVHRLTSKTVYSEFLNDTHRFCRALMEKKELRLAGSLIRAIEKGDLSAGSHYRSLLIAQLKVDYYGLTSNTKKRNEAYEERQRLYEAQRRVQREIYLRSVDIMILMSDLMAEQEEVREENERLQHLAETDALTSLPNRYALNRVLEQLFDEALRTGKSLGVGIADIDRFKQYNDHFGHRRGDECLREVGTALSRIAKEGEVFAARYGGDEFVLIYQDMSDDQIRAVVYDLLQSIPIRITHGFYNAVPTEESKPFEYLARADERMYETRKRRR